MTKHTYILALLLILVGVQILATALAIPIQPTGATAFGDPQDVSNPFIYLGLVIVMSALLIFLFRYKLFNKGVVAFFIIAVFTSVYFVLSAINLQFFVDSPIADAIALLIAIIAAGLMWKYPEWYVIDTIGFIMCAGATTIIGISFGIYPIIILLVLFAVYDAISVYQTKHMLKLAEGVLNLKIPALFIVPEDRGYSYLKSKKEWTDLDNRKERQAHILGMGDIVFPSTMVVSASVFIVGTKYFGLFTLPAIGAMIGSCIGMVALHWFAEKHPQAHAGLPFLNAFTVLGFLGMYGISVVVGV
jgi:presenilin-like A22 family membrane protease